MFPSKALKRAAVFVQHVILMLEPQDMRLMPHAFKRVGRLQSNISDALKGESADRISLGFSVCYSK